MMDDTMKCKDQMSKSGRTVFGYYTISSVQGASHVKDHTPCQDAYAFLNDGGCDHPFIMAIADGHGDKRYDMSQYGSELASKVAVKLLRRFYEELKDSHTLLFRSFRDDFPKHLIREWREEVLNHATDYGVDIEKPSEVFTRYGTTLLVALVTKEEILIGQLGDGDAVLVDGQGNCTTPFLQDDSLLGSATYSLSSTEASRFWKAARMDYPTQTQFLALSTDGLSNCFEDDDNFHKFMNSLYLNLKKSGPISEYEGLSNILFHYSQRGSGDDITLAAIELIGSKVGESPNPVGNVKEVKVANPQSSVEKEAAGNKELDDDMPKMAEESLQKHEGSPIIHLSSKPDEESINLLFSRKDREI
ncbi:protein phosphatase 2C domain-containing protein [Neobacillus drentensis]|uniref:PP2C family serine/threonine-protein phosphatase n=1 Tax=Neobacillus drentensis TaxID=220684 RepID=UPI001F174B8D|nr:PP2C family serine/threonine-protein phosphatase [Neobacillus drentensis]ULT56762.1 protein phosphatase 2C domain-containing protein [Neobacillus drentensis]